MKKALIVIDLQNDYFVGGNMELVNIDTTLKKANKLIQYARKQRYKIFIIQHFAKEGASFFAPKTEGVEINKDLDIQSGTIISKNYPNSFRETKLHEELQANNIDSIIVCGAMSHMCIDTTVRAGFDLGYKIELVNDACATKDLQFKDEIIKAKDVHNSFMSALGSAFCEVKDTNEILFI
ncbi:MAG: cysteine hydrolase [Desulfobacterales bacterium]|nr:cysteine hydrolase [Desulfobacterales bacterium]